MTGTTRPGRDTNRPPQDVDGPTRDTGWSTTVRERSFRVVFGDRVGLLLFLAALASFFLTWRIGFFITDSWTLANAFVSVVDGHLYVADFPYGVRHGATPGMHVVDGRLYARNYGQLIAALPVYWLLWGVSAVADPALALAGAFSLLVLALFVQLGRLLDRESTLTYTGIAVSLAAFTANAAVAVDVRSYWLPFAALQLSTMLAAGVTVLAFYRLVQQLYGRRTGVVGGAALALSSPVAFWATIPKRHALSAMLVVLTLYWLVRSRETARPRAIRFHALAYVAVGLLAWVHAAEALAVLGALVIADVATLRRFDPTRLAVVAGAFLAALAPFLVTNWLVSGQPLIPPRMLPVYRGNESVQFAIEAVPGLASSLPAPGPSFSSPASSLPFPSPESFRSLALADPTSTPTPGADDGHSSFLETLVAMLAGLLAAVLARVELFLQYAGKSLDAARDGDRLFRIFVRSGYLDGVTERDGMRVVSLTVLESMPLLGGLLALPVVVVRRLWRAVRGPQRTSRRGPAVAAGIFVVGATVTFLGLFLARLPIPVSWTVRYLHPLYPLWLFALLSLPAIRATLERDGSLLAWSYAAVVLVGGQLFVATLAVLDPTVSEAVQLHAILSLGTAGATGTWAVAYTAVGNRLAGSNQRRLRRVGAVAVGATGGITTTLLVLWALAYFPHSQFALPVLWELSELLPP